MYGSRVLGIEIVRMNANKVQCGETPRTQLYIYIYIPRYIYLKKLFSQSYTIESNMYTLLLSQGVLDRFEGVENRECLCPDRTSTKSARS